jgi:hypothetical protein
LLLVLSPALVLFWYYPIRSFITIVIIIIPLTSAAMGE